MINPILELSHISFYNSNKPNEGILGDISLKINPGESLGVLGPNGGGKSTLLKIIVGILKPTNGKIFFNGIDITKKRPKLKIAYVPQSFELHPLIPVTIFEFLNLGIDKSENKADCLEILNRVGLGNKEQQYIHSISGGELQRVLIARAIIQKPDLLVLDEPNNGIDSTGQDQIFNLLEELKSKNKMSLIVVDHNLNQIIKRSDRIICLNKDIHWHDSKNNLTKKVLENIYHCELEHLLIHDNLGAETPHHHCDQNHQHTQHSFLKNPKKDIK